MNNSSNTHFDDTPINDTTFDYTIVGCGIAGASLAYELSSTGAKILVLEAEPYAAYHTTGRSAAFYMEAYGNETVRKITQASRSFFNSPPLGFSENPLLLTCGALYLATKNQQQKLTTLHAELKDRIQDCKLVNHSFIKEKLPLIREDVIQNGFWEPQSMEIDVASLLNGYIKLAKKQGAEFLFNTRVEALEKSTEPSGKRKANWLINKQFQCTTLVNAAGAWADSFAELAQAKPLGLIPKKRTICVATPKGSIKVKDWPLTLDIEEQFYFKPEGNNLLITPADETPTHPHDVQANELEVAQGIDRVQQVMNIEFSKVQRQWAGLRTFSLDKSPVVGFDPSVENFFWMAGQGGYGIQMAPALAKIASKLAQSKDCNFDEKVISPARFH